MDTSTDPGSPLTAESIIKNFGTLSVGGIATLLKHSVLDNYGTITLAQGGVFGDQSSITNSGTIELTGDTLDVEVAIANAGGMIQVDGRATLKLNGATINGGTITDNGTIDVTADSSINGTTSGAPPVTTYALLNNGGVTVESGVTLTLDNVTVTGTTFTDHRLQQHDQGRRRRHAEAERRHHQWRHHHRQRHHRRHRRQLDQRHHGRGTAGHHQCAPEQWRGDGRKRRDADAGQRHGDGHDLHRYRQRRDLVGRMPPTR